MADKRQLAELFCEGKALLAAGKNIVQGLSGERPELRGVAIEIAYSLQSGDYTRQSTRPEIVAARLEGHAVVAPIIEAHGCKSLLDCGAGEGTRWLDFPLQLDQLLAFDAAYHRIKLCARNLDGTGVARRLTPMKANMLAMPLAARSVDAVMSCHAIEPNPDNDAARIIERMFAVARKLVVLLEPDHRGAEPAMRARMESHGYARNIFEQSERQPGFELVAEGRLAASVNPLNVTSFRVFRRIEQLEPIEPRLISPIDGSPLERVGDVLLDDARCMGFPLIGGIACLAPEDAIFLGCEPDATPNG